MAKKTMTAAKLLRYLFLAFSAAIAVNGICMLIYANYSIGSLLTLLLGLALFLPALFIRVTKRLMKRTACRLLMMILTFAVIISVLTSSFLFIYGNNNTVTYNEDYLIVLGCGVRGEKPTEPLKQRLDAALHYIALNPDCTIIVSGGQGNGESITEAEAMYLYLESHGVDTDRILKEERSTSTSENFKYSSQLIDGGLASYSAAFITNDFHIYRAASLARLQGFSLSHMSAPTSWYNLFPVYLREFLAIGQMIFLGK